MDGFDSLQELYDRLIEITQNELELRDHLLPFQPSIVSWILDQLTHMNENIKRNLNNWNKFHIEQHKIELERFSYLVNTYLRTRIKKIEENAPFLINLYRTDRERATRFLSRAEIKYLDRYTDSMDKYMKNVLKDMPDNMQRFNLAKLKQKDRDISYAFVQGCEEATIMDGENEVNLEPDVCRILSVPTIIELLEKGSRDFKLI